MSTLRVLIGCESSGVVREAFNAYSGVYAVSCDLQPADDGRTDYHHQGDVLEIINDGWDVLIAHPPCTYLCGSGMHWTTRGLRDPKLTEDAIKFAEALWRAKVPSICIENPVGALSAGTILGKPSQIIQPYEFGDDASKKTCLWLKGLPKLPIFTSDRVPGRLVEWPKGSGKMKERWSNQTDSGQNRLPPSKDRWKKRSITYPGIAAAMARWWVQNKFPNQQKTLFD